MTRRVSVYNVSNALSLYRLCAAPVVLWAALSGQRDLFVVLAIISLATDAVDGILARWRREETAFGARLDALADSATLAAGLVGVWVFERTPFLDWPGPLLTFLAMLAVATLISLVKFRKLPAFHLYSFKVADVALTLFFAALFLYGFIGWAYVAATALATLAAAEIILVALRIESFRTDLKGLWWVWRARD